MPSGGSSPRQQRQQSANTGANSAAHYPASSSSAASASSAGAASAGAADLSGKSRPAKRPPLAVILSRAVTPRAAWTNKDELLDVVYWQRQVLSALLGLAWGLLPLKGILGLALFFLLNCAAVYLYVCVFQAVDEEEYGGLGEILKEGLMTSFASFLVVWIVVFDHFHADSLALGVGAGIGVS